MTPCEELGYKVGDRFVVTEESTFKEGSIVQLFRDDDSDAPLFKLINGHCSFARANREPGAYANLEFVKKIEERPTKVKPTKIHYDMNQFWAAVDYVDNYHGDLRGDDIIRKLIRENVGKPDVTSVSACGVHISFAQEPDYIDVSIYVDPSLGERISPVLQSLDDL